MNINRRRFISGASSLAATGSFLTVAKHGSAQNPPVTVGICNAATAAHSQAAANWAVGKPLASDWLTVGGTLSVLAKNWTEQNVDKILAPAYQTVTPSMVANGNIPVAPILASMQQYQPNATTAQVQTLLQTIYSLPTSQVESVITQIQTGGVAPLIVQASTTARAISQSLLPPPPPPPIKQTSFAGLHGPPAYDCTADGAAVFFAGTAFIVVGVMTAGAAPVLVGAAWAGIALWGGTAAGAWAAGHAVVCGF